MNIDQASTDYYNNVIKKVPKGADCNFTSEQFVSMFLKFIPPNVPVISVGCGVGQFEYYLQKQGYSVFGIDPEPESFKKYTDDKHIVPISDTVQNFIKVHSHFIGNCTLMLYWPSPGESEYDFEAIQLLKPLCIYLYYDKLGGAAGHKLQKWLKHGVNNKYRLIAEMTKKCTCLEEYNIKPYLAITILAINTVKWSAKPIIIKEQCTNHKLSSS